MSGCAFERRVRMRGRPTSSCGRQEAEVGCQIRASHRCFYSGAVECRTNERGPDHRRRDRVTICLTGPNAWVAVSEINLKLCEAFAIHKLDPISIGGKAGE